MEITKEKLFNFLEEDLERLQVYIKRNNKEEIEDFFSYWNIHLKSLKD
jgi:hypothetical protein